MLHQAAMLIIFFIAAVPKTANASPSGHAKHESVLLSVALYSRPAAARQLRYILFFLIDAMLNSLYKIKRWALKTVAAAASPLNFKGSDGGFDLQKKLIRLPYKLRYNL
jgi:hypothetical protein